MIQIEAMNLALEYIEAVPDDRYNAEHIDRDALIAAIKETLAQTQEPDDIASILACRDILDAQPVPEVDRVIWPERTWVGLTDEDAKECLSAGVDFGWRGVMDATEAKLKEKNGYAEE